VGWLDALGWAGSVLLVYSLLQTRVLRFRALNLLASSILVVFNALLGIWPMVAMNTVLAGINLWFIRDGMLKSNERRVFQEDVDWVFHQAGVALTPVQVEAAVGAMRRNSVKFRDTVPAKVPALTSPCNF